MAARKPIELPPEVAQAFLRDMRAFFAEKNAIKADAIAARQLEPLNRHLGPGEKRLRIPDVKAMFVEMRKHLGKEP